MTEKIREQILAVRETGRTNMFDVPTVQHIANEMRFYELVIFLEEHRSLWSHRFSLRLCAGGESAPVRFPCLRR